MTLLQEDVQGGWLREAQSAQERTVVMLPLWNRVIVLGASLSSPSLPLSSVDMALVAEVSLALVWDTGTPLPLGPALLGYGLLIPLKWYPGPTSFVADTSNNWLTTLLPACSRVPFAAPHSEQTAKYLQQSLYAPCFAQTHNSPLCSQPHQPGSSKNPPWENRVASKPTS